MRSSVHWVLALAFLFGVWSLGAEAVSVDAAHPSASTMSAGCQALNDPTFDRHALFGTLSSASLWADETLIFSAWDNYPPYLIYLYLDSVKSATAQVTVAAPGVITYTVPQNITVTLDWVAETTDMPLPLWDIQCLPRSGCAEWMPLTADAAVGRFVADAPTYWVPGKLVQPTVTIPAGKTAWVLGQDASGAYYKIAWACDLLWVPVSSMGPNVGDPVWDGAPLPTSVVQ